MLLLRLRPWKYRTDRFFFVVTLSPFFEESTWSHVKCVNPHLDGDWTTHWKNISESGSFPQVGMNIKKSLKPRTSIVWTIQTLSTLVPPSHHCPTNPHGCLSKWPESSHVVLRVHRWNDNPQQPVQHTQVRLNKLWAPKPIAKQSCKWKVQ